MDANGAKALVERLAREGVYLPPAEPPAEGPLDLVNDARAEGDELAPGGAEQAA